MSDTVRSWRRKIGYAAMVISLLLAVPFVRSYTVYQMFAYSSSSRQYMVQSFGGYLIWNGWSPRDDEPLVWTCESYRPNPVRDKGLITRRLAISGSPNSVSWIISYGWLFVPTVLLSIYSLRTSQNPPPSQQDETSHG